MSNHQDQKSSKQFDQPDRIKSDKESILDKFEDEQMTDPVPLEDQKQDMKNEKNKRKTKSSSSSERANRS